MERDSENCSRAVITRHDLSVVARSTDTSTTPSSKPESTV